MFVFAAETASWLGLTWIDWTVLAAYFIVVVGIGIWSYKKVQNMADYFMGGRRFGKILMMFFAFGSGTSGEQAIGVVAGTWRAGLAGIWWQFLWLWATPFYWIVAPIMRRMRALTTADFFEHRFNTSTATLYSIYGIIMAIAFMAGGLFASGKMVSALTGGELEKMALKLAVAVPEFHLETDKDTKIPHLTPGVIFTTNTDHVKELDAGTFPDKLKTRLANRRPLSERLTVGIREAGKSWTLTDAEYDFNYPIDIDTVEEKNDDGEEVTVEKLHIRGPGWRLLKGYEFAILAMTVLFVIYGMAGGLGAAIVTDFIQGILTITFSFLLLPFVFYEIGGFGALNENSGLKDGMLNLVATGEVAAELGKEPITIFYVFMLSLTALIGIVVQPHIMGVCGAGKTEFEGRFGFTAGNFLKRLCTLAWTFTGLAAIVWYLGADSPLQHHDRPAEVTSTEFQNLPEDEQQKIIEDRKLYDDIQARTDADFKRKSTDEKERIVKVDDEFADGLFGRAAYDILPKYSYGLVGLLLASLLAAVMSTSDAQMVVSSGLFTENIYKKYLIRNASQRHYLWVGRFAGLLIVLAALVLQATFTDVIDVLKVIIKTPAAIGISLWIGVIWRRWTSLAVWVSTLTSAAAWAFVAYYPDVLQDWGLDDSYFNSKGKLLDAWVMTAYLSTGVTMGVLVSLITPRVNEEKLNRFYRLIHTPVKKDEHITQPCTLAEDAQPPLEKLFNLEDVEMGKPTWTGVLGFLISWGIVAGIVWLTGYLARVW